MRFLHVWHDDVHVHRDARIPVKLNGEATRDQIRNAVIAEQTLDCVRSLRHGSARALPKGHRFNQCAGIHRMQHKKSAPETQFREKFIRRVVHYWNSAHFFVVNNSGAHPLSVRVYRQFSIIHALFTGLIW